MAPRAEKVRRRQQRKERKRQQARARGYEVDLPECELIFNPPGEIKMSEALQALVEPEWYDCKTEDAMRRLLTLGMTAWNASLLDAVKRTALLDKLAQTLPVELRADFPLVVEPLIHRKEQLFPHVKRPMLNFQLTWQPSGEPYLTVISGLNLA